MTRQIDRSKFKGFAFVNETVNDVACIVENESAFTKEFLLRPNQVYYANVADVVRIVSVVWATHSGFKYLDDEEKEVKRYEFPDCLDDLDKVLG